MSSHPLVQCVVHASAARDESWLCTVAEEAKAFSPQGLPTSTGEWQALMRDVREHVRSEAMHYLLECSKSHPALAHYCPAPCTLGGEMNINHILHDKSLDAEQSRSIARLLAGGQGLRGGDPAFLSSVTPRTACLFCLREGVRRRESLLHVVFHCPAYADIRAQPSVAEVWHTSAADVLCFSRDLWSWRQLQANRAALVQILQRRRENLKQWGALSVRGQSDRAGLLWPCVVPALHSTD